MLLQRTLHLGPLDNNTYLLVDRARAEAAVVDVGFEPERVVEAVQRAGVALRLLLCTHAHYDHAAGMRAVQEALGGEFWLHPHDRFLLDGLTSQGAMFGLPPSRAPDEVHELYDGQELMVGAEPLRVIHTPGHSPGSVCFRSGDTLWAGDILFAGSIGRTDLPGGSFETLERSVRTRLFPLGDDIKVLPGHGPPTTIGDERRHNPFVGERAGLA